MSLTEYKRDLWYEALGHAHTSVEGNEVDASGKLLAYIHSSGGEGRTRGARARVPRELSRDASRDPQPDPA